MDVRPDEKRATDTFAHALLLYRQADLPAADSCLDELLRQHPKHFDALHLQGVIASQLHQPTRAVDRLRRALDENGGAAAVHRHLGNAWRELGRPEEALQSYARSIELRRDFKEAYVNRALVLLTLRRPREALTDFDHALSLGADDAQVHLWRATGLIDLHRPAEALESCEKALARLFERMRIELSRSS